MFSSNALLLFLGEAVVYRSRQRRAARRVSTSPVTSIPRSSVHCRSIPIVGRGRSSAISAARRFDDVTADSGAGATAPRSSRGAAFGDFDNDGDVDVLVMNMNEAPSLLRNDYAGPNAWLDVSSKGARRTPPPSARP